MKIDENTTGRIEILENGPYLVSGGLSLSKQALLRRGARGVKVRTLNL